MRLRLALAVLAVLLARSARSAERPWVRVESPHFSVMSNDGEKSARKIAWQFEQVRAVAAKLWPWARTDLDRPLLVLGARDEQTMKSLVPEYWEKKDGVRPDAVFATGRDRYFVALRTVSTALTDENADKVNPYRLAYWSYVTLVLRASAERDFPLWLDRGLSEFFSNTLVREKDVHVGRIIPWHLEQLQHGILPLKDLVAMDRESPYYRQGDKLRAFDAQAWALVHYLVLAGGAESQAKFNRFIGLLNQGKNQGTALAETYGDLGALDRALGTYVSKHLYNFMRYDVDLDVKSDGFRSSPVAPAEALVARASLHAATGRAPDAKALIEQARALDPKGPGAAEIEGLLADLDKRDDDARAAYAKAIELGSVNDHVYYRDAQLRWKPNADKATLDAMEKSLLKAVELNPRSARGYSFLADVTSDQGRHAEALVLVKKAIEIEPVASYHRLAAARILWDLKDSAGALQQAETARDIAQNDAERRNAEKFIAWTKSAGLKQ